MSSLKPVMIPTVPINAATPKVIPVTETNVFNEMVRFRRLARKYRRPTKISYGIAKRLFLRTQLRKEHHITDRSLIGEAHGETVNTDALSRRRRHSVFQGPKEILIDYVRFLVTGGALCRLSLEALPLIQRVVQLRKRIGNLPPRNVELESIGERGVGILPPGQRRDLHRIIGNKSRLLQIRLDGFFKNLIHDVEQRPFRGDPHV